MGKPQVLLAAAIAALSCVAAVIPARAADMGAGAPPAVGVPSDSKSRVETAAGYLRRRAVLLMIRATFDLLRDEDVPGALAADSARIGAAGPSEEEAARLDRDLLAEGSYYLVSLKYLAEAGGAVWPDDRPERSYASAALVALDALQDRLIAAVHARTDPLSIFEQAQDILALTEGYIDVPAALDHFAGRDLIVERILRDQLQDLGSAPDIEITR